MSSTSSYIISNPSHCLEVLRNSAFRVDHPFRSTRQIFGPSVVDMEGDAHKRQKKHWMYQFSQRNVTDDSLTCIVESAVHAGFEYALNQGDLFLATEYIPNKVVLSLLQCKDVDPMEHFKRIRPLIEYLETGEKNEETASAKKYIKNIELTMGSELFGDIPPKERENNLAVFALAGSETTVVAMKILMTLWVNNTDEFATAHKEYGTQEFVLNVLQSDPPLGIATRYCAEDTEIDSQKISKGDIVHASILDTSENICPFHKKAERPTAQRQSLIFGTGKHHCPGHFLAKSELYRFTEELLKLDITDYEITQSKDDTRPMNFRHPSALTIQPKN